METKKKSSENIGSFSIIPKAYEAGLDRKYGIILSDLKNEKRSEFQGNLEKNIFFVNGYYYSANQINDEILEKYKSIPGFCSIKIRDEKELHRHIKNIHELSYNHYVWAKENDMRNNQYRFPYNCGGNSSNNLLLSLMERGYPNASILGNDLHDYACIGLPFLFGRKEEKGFIVTDPTSDQSFRDEKNAPRNNLFVVFGNKWEYKTDWDDGADLFPSKNDNSGFSNLETLRENPSSGIFVSERIEEYFKKVFENPIEVDVKYFR